MPQDPSQPTSARLLSNPVPSDSSVSRSSLSQLTRSSALVESTTMEQHNGYSLLVRVGESGEGMKGSRRNWSRKLVRATMVAGWENKVKGPWVNHSCCAVPCNCEYVPTEFVRDRKGGSFSVNVKTTRDVKSTGGGPVEFLVDYGEDYLKVLGGKCRCCAHTRATAQCRFARAG